MYGACLLFNERDHFSFDPSPTFPPLKPRQRWQVERDISTCLINDGNFTAAGTLLGGFNSPITLQWADLSLLAAGPEVTDAPDYTHFGINSTSREPWDGNVELQDAFSDDQRVAVRGQAPSRYVKPSNDESTWLEVPLDVTVAVSRRRMLLAIRPRQTEHLEQTSYHFALIVNGSTSKGTAAQVKVGDHVLSSEVVTALPVGPVELFSPQSQHRLVATMISPSLETCTVEGPTAGATRPRYEASAWRVLFDAVDARPHVLVIDALKPDESAPALPDVSALCDAAFDEPLDQVIDCLLTNDSMSSTA